MGEDNCTKKAVREDAPDEPHVRRVASTSRR